MKKVCLLLFPIAFSFYGCYSSPNQLNSAWKKSLAQLQITPVMPLREHLEVGEVYRYRKRPGNYFEDGQVEPPIAFIIDVNSYDSNEIRIWPTFTYDSHHISSLGASIKSIGVFSGSIEGSDTINLKVVDGFSKHAKLVDVINAFVSKKLNETEWQVKDKYKEDVNSLSNLWFRLGRFSNAIRASENKIIYLRIPVEVYYAKGIQVSISKKSGSRVAFDANAIRNIPDVNVAYDGNTSVVLIETFNVPMAIGYKGLLYEVHTDSFVIKEILEDLQ